MASSLWIKICGVTSLDDARAVADAGADAIGLNFAPQSQRVLSIEAARAIVREVGPRVEWVGVFVNASPELVNRVRDEVGLDWLQLHGAERPEDVLALGPRAFKALGIADPGDVQNAMNYSGDRLLVDAKVPGAAGGTGRTFDWSLLGPLAGRRLVLAGGLRPENVENAVSAIQPFGIDTASGVESSPGKKDHDRVRDFVRRARQASEGVSS